MTKNGAEKEDKGVRTSWEIINGSRPCGVTNGKEKRPTARNAWPGSQDVEVPSLGVWFLISATTQLPTASSWRS